MKNMERAQFAELAIEAFNGRDKRWRTDANALDEAVRDLVTDLCHSLSSRGISRDDIWLAMTRAFAMFENEQDEVCDDCGEQHGYTDCD